LMIAMIVLTTAAASADLFPRRINEKKVVMSGSLLVYSK